MASIEELISKLGDKRRYIRRNAEKELVMIAEPAVLTLLSCSWRWELDSSLESSRYLGQNRRCKSDRTSHTEVC